MNRFVTRFHDRNTTGQAAIIWKRLLFRSFPILAVDPLLVVAQGGLIPVVWQQLFRILLQPGTAQTGGAAVTLVAQSLVSVITWGVYLWFALRELVGFGNLLLSTRQRGYVSVRASEVRPEELYSQQTARPQLTGSQTSAFPGTRTGLPLPPPAFRREPFDKKMPTPFREVVQSPQVGLGQPQGGQSAYQVTSPWATSPPINPAPFDPDATQIRTHRPQSTRPPSRNHPPASELPNPYEVQNNVFALPETAPGDEFLKGRGAVPEPFKESYPAQSLSLPPTGFQMQKFVYGNPFDGPLPEVFQEDEDLKRMVERQRQSTIFPPPENRR